MLVTTILAVVLARTLSGGWAPAATAASYGAIGSAVGPRGARGPVSGTTASIQLGAIPPPRPGTAHVYFRGPGAKREIAITFDDGLCAACARRIIDYLLRSGERASILPNGMYATSWDPLAAKIRELVARGQLAVGNHTFHHVDAVGVGAAAFGADLEENERWIERTFGLIGRPFFRPPYGAYDSATLAEAGALGYTQVIMWSGTLADSNLRTIPYILHAIRHWAKPGAIILCHANYPPTSEALSQIFAILREKHLQPVTIGQLLGASPYHAYHRRPTLGS